MRVTGLPVATLGLVTALLAGCVSFFVQPKTYQCASIGTGEWGMVRSGGRRIGFCTGMSREELLREYELAKAAEAEKQAQNFLKQTKWKHPSANESYLIYEGCRVWRFVFENDRLVEAGTAVMEMGIWFFWEQPIEGCRLKVNKPSGRKDNLLGEVRRG